MSTWAEIEAVGENYREWLVTQADQEKARRADIEVNQRVKEKIRRELAGEKANFILERLDARNALMAVRDEVWHEGEISPLTRRDSYQNGQPVYHLGLSLASAPFLFIGSSGMDRSLVLKLVADRVYLNVEVSLADVGEVDEESIVRVVDHGPRYSEAKRVRTIEELISAQGLGKGLYTIIPEKMSGIHSEEVDLKQPNAREEFCFALATVVNTRKGSEDLPSQFRVRSQEAVDHLPPALKDAGVIQYMDLRAWEHTIRKSNRLVVGLERLLGRSA